MVECKDCIHYCVCDRYTAPNESYPEVGGCKLFKPTADVAEVVRCKDCKHSKNDTFYCKRYNAVYCEFDNMIKPKNHFCSYGERL